MAFQGQIGALKFVVFCLMDVLGFADLRPELVSDGRILNSSDWYQVALFCLLTSAYIYVMTRLTPLHLFVYPP